MRTYAVLLFLLLASSCSSLNLRMMTSSSSPLKPSTHTLVLLRHGESTWNEENRFTGWFDCPLSSTGLREALEGGKELRKANLSFDIAFTSLLKRAIKTLWISLEELDLMYIPVRHSWRLNERHYGALQGLDKKETVLEYGKEQVQVWRRSYDIPPPSCQHGEHPLRGQRLQVREYPERGPPSH